MSNFKIKKINGNGLRAARIIACALCGSYGDNVRFKNDYICRDCLKHIKQLANR